jgi:hypothetical protein
MKILKNITLKQIKNKKNLIFLKNKNKHNFKNILK